MKLNPLVLEIDKVLIKSQVILVAGFGGHSPKEERMLLGRNKTEEKGKGNV